MNVLARISLITLFTINLIAQTPCENGMAGQYPCNGYDLQSFISLEEMDGIRGNDSWGWTDPEDGNEYAIMGLKNGTAFIDISDPINPVYLGKLPSHTGESIWRDIKVYQNHAFIVSEASNHGMQVFDLTRLRTVSNPPELFTEDAHYDGFGASHNIAINEISGFAYVIGSNRFQGGPIFIDINDPKNPNVIGGYAEASYTHDAQIVNYKGPDQDHFGKEIYIGSNENKVDIVDVKVSGNIMTLKVGYAGGCKNHEFSIIGSQMISKSLPPIRNIQLVHNSNDDNCKNYVTQTLSVDIRNFAYKKVIGSNIILKLNGWKDQIIYTYN